MDDNKQKKIYYIILFAFVIAFACIFLLYLSRKSNTSIVVQGSPKDIVWENYSGDLSFEACSVYITDGNVVNTNDISFDIDGSHYFAQPGELSFEFHEQAGAYEGATPARSISNNKMDFLSTSAYGSKVMIKNPERIIETDYNDDGDPNQVSSECVDVYISDLSSDGLLRMWSNSTLYVDSDVIVKYKGDVISDSGTSLDLENYSEFALENISQIDVVLSARGEMLRMEGQISKMLGTLKNNGELYCTSGTSQSSFFCGSQLLNIEGKELKASYEYTSDSTELMLNGRPKKAKLEDIDILEGFVQFMLSNFNSFFLSFVGAALALAIDKTLKK